LLSLPLEVATDIQLLREDKQGTSKVTSTQPGLAAYFIDSVNKEIVVPKMANRPKKVLNSVGQANFFAINKELV
jgi:hypothetical protein